MLTVTTHPRVFLYKDGSNTLRLNDPDISLTPEEVKDYYANTYPLLTTAIVELPVIENDEEQYRFTNKMGYKG